MLRSSSSEAPLHRNTATEIILQAFSKEKRFAFNSGVRRGSFFRIFASLPFFFVFSDNAASSEAEENESDTDGLKIVLVLYRQTSLTRPPMVTKILVAFF